jgi:hypothetical protein
MVGGVSIWGERQWKYGKGRKARLTRRVDGRGDCDIVALCLPLVLCFCDCDALRLPCISLSLPEIQTIRAQESGKKTSAIRARNSQESVLKTVFKGKGEESQPPKQNR